MRPLHHGLAKRAFESGRPGSNGPPRGGAPVLYLHELRPPEYARLESNQRPLLSHGSALCPLSYGRLEKKEPPAGVEPAPRPYEGRVLAVDTTEALEWRRRESNPLLLVASEVLFPMSFIPRWQCGRVESNHHSRRRRGYSPLSSPLLSVRMENVHLKGRPTGLEPVPRGSRPRMLAVTPRPPRAGTTGVEPATYRLTSECSGR